MKYGWQLFTLLAMAVLSIIFISFGKLDFVSNVKLEKLSTWANVPEPCYSQNTDVYNIFHTQANEGFWTSMTKDQYKKYKLEWESFVETIPERPRKKGYKEKGIVYTCYSGIFRPTLLSIMLLRKTGCKLPIEVWHNGNELNDKDTKLLQSMENITVMDIKMVNDTRFSFHNHTEGDKMFEMKGASILYTRFDQLLFLDGDNIPVRDPTFLFTSLPFLDTGAIFWKDFWKTRPENPIWKIINSPCDNEHEQESGQIMIP